MKIATACTRSLQNIAKFGDTDIFPFLFERDIFFDRPSECCDLLLDIHKNFDEYVHQSPPITHESLTQVGYTGFRWATQIEPFWNAYYLALVLYLADQIEAQRIPIEEQTVFSYRYHWSDSDSKIFGHSSWNDYRVRCIELCQSEETEFVVLTDIANFYPRIYHHRLENQLTRLPRPSDVPKRIMRLLGAFSKHASYGLPVGGPASRILSELALNSVDRLLRANRIRFCRYSDDYTIFCKSRSEAYENLVLLAEKLFNEGLVLQKNKTRIMPSDEFYNTWSLLDPKIPAITDEQKLLNISIRFDPYSETAEEDYKKLTNAVSQVDVVGILGRQIAKTTIDMPVTKQAIGVVRALGDPEKEGTIRTLLQRDNLDVLSPVFVTVMRLVRSIYDGLSNESKVAIDRDLVRIFEEHDHILRVEVNLAFYLQALSQSYSFTKEQILVDIYNKEVSPILRRIIVSTMANWNCSHWISDRIQGFGSLNEWEKRAMILASYSLTDEGKHWRAHTKDSWTAEQQIIHDWCKNRFNTHKSVRV